MIGLEECKVRLKKALVLLIMAVIIGASGLSTVELMNMVGVDMAWVKNIQSARNMVIVITSIFLGFFAVGIAPAVICIARKLWERRQWPGL
ncbi:MAG: hypothetical protein QXW44_07615 [Pyrobaculum sp.]